MKKACLLLCAIFVVAANGFCQESPKGANTALAADFEKAAKEQLLDRWYPLVIDSVDGGYYSEVTHDFKLGEKHNKMIVTQARHIWTNAKAAEIFPNNKRYLSYAGHGVDFLKEVMWDPEHGGFYSFVSKEGVPMLKEGEEKSAYGNAFAIYGLAAYYKVSGDIEALDLAKKSFLWLEENAHDPVHKGYYNVLHVDGKPVERTEERPSTSDVGYKDQNSSIHLLEAFTELYQVWPNDLLADRLTEMLVLIRDTITTEDGYMRLFFEPDWTPVSFRGTSRQVVEKHYYLDHVSFGHDVETAFLMLEASHALGIRDDEKTLETGKKMLDHSLRNGWDEEHGGFYDGGYYFEGDKEISILNADKNWWAQAEGLNTLLLMHRYFPEDELEYDNYFSKLWGYTQRYLIDDTYGGWYEWGLDTRPESKTALKGHIWKASYHNFRALTNVMLELRN